MRKRGVKSRIVIPGRCEASNPESRREGKERAQANLKIPGSSPMAMPRNDGVDERLWALPMSRPDSGNVPHVAQPIEYSHNRADNTNK
jgi:hypothetical protein